jgi:chromosome segregation ATPase
MKKVLFYVGGIFIITSLLSSCVSKKKYEELAHAKRAVDRELLAEQQAKAKLEAELKLAKEDFNTIRYKLTANNAEKDKTIDQLYNQLRSLESKQIELKSELSDATDRIKSTKQSKEEQIAALEKLLQKTSNERDTFRKELSSIQGKLEFENQKLKSQIETLTGAAEGKEDEIAKLKAKNEEINAKLRQIQKSKSATDAEIKKLTNQVNLLKKELAK